MINYHTCKDGKKIKISELETDHLVNIIKMIIQKSKDGLKVRWGCGGSLASDFDYDENILYGEAALKRMNYDAYVTELANKGKV